MTSEMIGREAELSVVHAFFDRPPDECRMLVLEGDPGIGKSTLWLAAIEAARERAFRVLASRPAEAERTLAYVVLGDLFADAEPEVLDALPAPRRRAFETALLREEPDLPVDPRALGAAILTILPALAKGRPLLLAIDDDQWMDDSSAATLAFALRRSLRQPILLLLSRRLDGAPATALAEAVDPAAVERLRVGPLSIGAVQLLLRNRLGVTFPRPMLLRLHELSGGNAFHALELARAQALNPIRDTTLPVFLAPGLEGLVEARLDNVDATTRTALLLIAAHGRSPTTLLRSLDVPPETLGAALRAKLIEQSGDIVVFAHPLLASAVYQSASEIDRRMAHRQLAAVLVDPVERSRHVALGADGPSDELAASLDAAVKVAHRRGNAISAAELAQYALRLTPPEAVADRHRRAIATARALFEAGAGALAMDIAADIRTKAPAGRSRAEALILSAEVGTPHQALAFLEAALREAGEQPDLRAVIHALSAAAGRGVNDLDWAERHGEAALRLADELNDDGLRVRALATLAPIRFDHGDPKALDLAQRAYKLARRLGDPDALKDAAMSLGHVLTWSGMPDRARTWLEGELEYWRDRDEEARWGLLLSLSLVDLWSGRWTTAGGFALLAHEIDAQYGRELPQEHFAPALIALHTGDFDLARTHARAGLAMMRGQLIPAFPAVLGICEMWTGDPMAALPYLAEAETMSNARGLDEANMRWWRAEYVEALLQAGKLETAEALIEHWDTVPASISRQRVAAQLTRCRGLVAASRGDLSIAVELFRLASEQHQVAGDPFGRSRALLALGAASRRTRQKRSSRIELEAALAGFEALGAMSWVAATRAELGRIGGRQRIEGLSPSERRVAELVVEGRTNREVASALFLGETTVASHLNTIYAKLGVRSRTELAKRLQQSTPPSPSSGKGNIPTS